MYGIIFKLFRYTKIKGNRVSFIIDSGESFKGNLDYIKKEGYLLTVSKSLQVQDIFF